MNVRRSKDRRNAPDPDFRVLSFQPQPGHAAARRYQKRRTHHKSRAGCLVCKAKRVKCDEARPCCSRCQRNSVWCSYSSGITKGPVNRPLAGNFCTSPAITGLGPSQESTPYGTPRLVLLHHFQTRFSELQLHLLGRASANPILALAIAHPFLLDAVLAVSASHLRHHRTTSQARRESRVAEHFQQGLALQGFRRALAQFPLALDQHSTADALVLTCMLLNLLAFSLDNGDENGEDNNPNSSWIFCPHDPDRLSWFSLQLGLKPLLAATAHIRASSNNTTTILAQMYGNKTPPDSKPYYSSGETPPTHPLPPHWLSFLGGGDEDDNPLLEPARTLAQVRDIPPRADSFLFYVEFVGTLDTDFRFRSLLEARDPRAVWLLGYWLGLMGRFRPCCWWLSGRVEREWRAVCEWLGQRSRREAITSRSETEEGEEGRVWGLLMSEIEEAGVWPRPGVSRVCLAASYSE